jgi:hypothetical protein
MPRGFLFFDVIFCDAKAAISCFNVAASFSPSDYSIPFFMPYAGNKPTIA